MKQPLDPMIWPILAQVGLSIFVIMLLGFQRVSQIRKRGIAAIRETGFIGKAEQTSANLKHQFEAPILFYVVALIFVVSLEASLAALSLAWLYVALRFVHAKIQLTHDTIFPWRFWTFVLSMITLTCLFCVAVFQALAA